MLCCVLLTASKTCKNRLAFLWQKKMFFTMKCISTKSDTRQRKSFAATFAHKAWTIIVTVTTDAGISRSDFHKQKTFNKHVICCTRSHECISTSCRSWIKNESVYVLQGFGAVRTRRQVHHHHHRRRNVTLRRRNSTAASASNNRCVYSDCNKQ